MPRGAANVRYGDDEVRITVSWKADVFEGDDGAARIDAGGGPLDLETVVDVFGQDLRARGLGSHRPSDPLVDQAWIGTLAETYRDPAPTLA